MLQSYIYVSLWYIATEEDSPHVQVVLINRDNNLWCMYCKHIYINLMFTSVG